MTPRQLRLVRAASASSAATVLAAVSHTVGGGPAPHPLLIVALSAFLVPLSAVLVGSRPHVARIALTVAVSQGAFHVLFQLLGAPSGRVATAAHAHHGDATLLLDALPSHPAMAFAMTGAHAIAAAITTMLLWRGEDLLKTIARWVGALLRPALPAPAVSHARPVPLRSARHPLPHAGISAAISRRGPPMLACG